MKTYIYTDLTEAERAALCSRQQLDIIKVNEIIQPIGEQVRTQGDAAVKAYTERFDGVKLTALRVSAENITNGAKTVSDSFKAALAVAIQNIQTFHAAQAKGDYKIETMPGVACWRRFTPIETVGLYIPGGTAPLFSTLLMTAIPAQLAGCSKIVLCTPPGPNGLPCAEILYATQVLGNVELYTIGGAQAIFAMAYGTESVPKVDKIYGPGNQYVTAAKVAISSFCAIDMVAGPSEVLVLADPTANPAFVAADLLSQAEHGTDSQVVLVSPSASFTNAVQQEIETQIQVLPRAEIAKKCLEKSFSIVTETLEDGITMSNEYAPEHLILAIKNWEAVVPKITNAGSVFCGNMTPESAGDYASGTNHTLPTSGFARSTGGLSVEAFGKYITFQHITPTGLAELGPSVETLAQEEALDAHANAVSVRLQTL